MKLQPVAPAALGVVVVCIQCSTRCKIEQNRPQVFADLEGHPFLDYYCASCAKEVTP